MVVVVAIIGIITTVALVSQSSFNKTLILSNTAYDIALTIRSAQSFGIGSRAVTGGSYANAGYGVHFDSSVPRSFIFFADTNTNGDGCHTAPSEISKAPDSQPGDCIYTGPDTLIQTYTLGNRMKVNKLWVKHSSLGWLSSDSGDSLDITFSRPNPDTAIVWQGYTGGNVYTDYMKACISITSPQGGTRSILVGASGVISVSTAECSTL